jgi:hypothetical protein
MRSVKIVTITMIFAQILGGCASPAATPSPKASPTSTAASASASPTASAPSPSGPEPQPEVADIFGPKDNVLVQGEGFQLATDPAWQEVANSAWTWDVKVGKARALLTIASDAAPGFLTAREARNSAVRALRTRYPSVAIQARGTLRGPAANRIGSAAFLLTDSGQTLTGRLYVTSGPEGYYTAMVISEPRHLARVLAKLEPYLLTLRAR